MKKENISVRIASPDDAAKILSIYAPYVRNTVITFEYEVPSLEEFTERIKKTLKKYPYLVAEVQGEILGYAYTGPFVGRAKDFIKSWKKFPGHRIFLTLTPVSAIPKLKTNI